MDESNQTFNPEPPPKGRRKRKRKYINKDYKYGNEGSRGLHFCMFIRKGGKVASFTFEKVVCS